MEKFKNPFAALVELSNAGDDVVLAKVSISMHVSVHDRDFLCSRILNELLPSYVIARRFYDGSFVVVSKSDLQTVTNACVSSVPDTIEFDASVELDDGLVHDVRLSLEKSVSARRDYVIRDVRSIVLRGTVFVDVDDDETLEA